MSNVVTLHADKRWKAVIEYGTEDGLEIAEHYFEEILDLHLIVEHGPDWNRLIRCTVTLNRQDDGEDQNTSQKSLPRESSDRQFAGSAPHASSAWQHPDVNRRAKLTPDRRSILTPL